MRFSKTTAYKKIKALTKRIRCIPGGTSASKTISILLYLIACAQCDKTPTITSIVGESMPFLRKAVMRDFLNILKSHNYFKEDRWDITNSIYTFETGSIIEFFGVEDSTKVRGARRDRLFINECNNISFASFEELEVRTKEFVFLDWNPVNEFWYYEHLKGKEYVDELTLTYLDNEALDRSIIDSIESRKNRPSWFKVYGLGQLGEVEGRIFTGWQTLDQVPHEARLERYGLDFGYSNDPSALVALYYYNGGYILDELCFQKGLSNKQIADIILTQPKRALTIADSAEPKSIDEIASYGITIQPTTKGPGSVVQRIQMAQDQQISVTSRSVNILKEYRNYLWEVNKDGQTLNEPEHTWSHSMDAFMYALNSVQPMIKRKEMMDMMPRYQQKTRVNPGA